jgi:hypothetical protein
MEVPTPANRKTSTCVSLLSAAPISMCSVCSIGATGTGQHVPQHHAVLRCRVLEPDDP